jgi:hypothetical protein
MKGAGRKRKDVAQRLCPNKVNVVNALTPNDWTIDQEDVR